MKKYNLVHLPSQFKGYVSKLDKTSLADIFLVAPSQNVLYEEDGTIQIRKGYTLDGANNTATTAVRASYDWQTHLGNERNLRMYDDELEVRFVPLTGTVAWNRVKAS